MRPVKIVDNRISIDCTMRNIAQCMISDFQDNLADPLFCQDFNVALKSQDISRIREAAPAPSFDMDEPTFKATYQMQSLLKRHRFEKDLFTEDDLKTKAINTFLETQTRIASIDLMEPRLAGVLHNARRFIARWLGPYDEEEHRSLCRFGRRASVGIPGRLACEAARWELPISGSKCQIEWFDAEMRGIDAVQNYWMHQLESDPPSKERSIYHEIDTLKLTFVPKTYKALRGIVPNSTIGSYMSYGLGEMMRKRLKRIGYNIKTLQKRHRELAQIASDWDNLATVDLSSASDSISVALVQQLFPEDWFAVLCKSRIGKLKLPGTNTPVQMETFCTMGVGYTFPLQTMVFLALVKGIQQYMYPLVHPGTVSVYGDDLIYPVDYHKWVTFFFGKAGFVINQEKSFSSGPFRESCGGDYYRSVDVRPFQPEGGGAKIRGGKSYEAVLYKMINGLLFRWSEYEVRRTLLYLVSELERNGSLIKRVPCDFPDDAGIKCPRIDSWDFLQHARCGRPKYVGHGVFRFPYLTFKVSTRKEDRHDPYYWVALRDCNGGLFDYSDPMQLRAPVSFTVQLINELTGADKRTPQLICKTVGANQSTRSKLTRRRQAHVETHVTVSGDGSYTSQLGTSTFGDR